MESTNSLLTSLFSILHLKPTLSSPAAKPGLLLDTNSSQSQLGLYTVIYWRICDRLSNPNSPRLVGLYMQKLPSFSLLRTLGARKKKNWTNELKLTRKLGINKWNTTSEYTYSFFFKRSVIPRYLSSRSFWTVHPTNVENDVTTSSADAFISANGGRTRRTNHVFPHVVIRGWLT